MGKCHSEPKLIQKSSSETWKEWEHQEKVTVTWLRDKHSWTQTLEMEKADFKEIRKEIQDSVDSNSKRQVNSRKMGGSSLTGNDLGSPPGL